VFSQAVVDLRRGIDVLMSRSDVDSSRIAYVGHSYGAQWGAILCAIEKRIKTAVLMAGVPSDSVFIVESNDPAIVAFRESATKEMRENYMRIATAPFAAISYVPCAKPAPLFFQFALKEPQISLCNKGVERQLRFTTFRSVGQQTRKSRPCRRADTHAPT